MFRGTKAETLELTMAEKIWKLIVEILIQITEFLETETESLIKKIITDNQMVAKSGKFNTLLQAG